MPTVRITINGTPHDDDVEARTLLVHYLRENLGLTGTHVGCDTSQCGACTVLLDGQAVKSCTVFALQADGSEVLTVEGLERDGKLHPVQRAFWDMHGLQCGFCTPGMMMTALDLIAHNPSPTESEIRSGLEGVICRCTGYQNIVRAVQRAAVEMVQAEAAPAAGIPRPASMQAPARASEATSSPADTPVPAR